MYVIIGSHFVPLKRKFLLIALVIVRITLNVIVGQIPLNVRKTTVCPSIKNLLSNCQTLRQRFLLALRKMTLKKFLSFNFLLANKGLCCMNLCYLRLLKDMSVPMIQYAYATRIATTIICNHVLQDLNIDVFKFKPPDCNRASSPFIYNPTGHVMNGGIILSPTYLCDMSLPKGRNTASLTL
jgi:hypothetical protein